MTKSEAVIFKKLYEWFSDDNEEWKKNFLLGGLDSTIDLLYDSFCDDCFWVMAHVYFSEIKAVLDERLYKKGGDEQGIKEFYYNINTYYLENAPELLFNPEEIRKEYTWNGVKNYKVKVQKISI